MSSPRTHIADDTARLAADAADLLRRTRTDRGLPATIEDPTILRKVATLMKKRGAA